MITRGKIPFKRICKKCLKLYLPSGRHSFYCPDCIKETREKALKKARETRKIMKLNHLIENTPVLLKKNG